MSELYGCEMYVNQLKTNNDADKDDLLLEHVIPIIKKCDPDYSHSRISSFNKQILWKVKDKLPDLPSIGALFNCGLDRDEENQKTIREPTPIATFLDHLRPGKDSVNLCAETLTKAEVDLAHGKNIKVLAWFPGLPDGPEDLDKFKQLEAMGVDVLCTNRPDIAILDYKRNF